MEGKTKEELRDASNKQVLKIINAEWLDKDTFAVFFEPCEKWNCLKERRAITQIVGEYHKDEDKFVFEEQWYEEDGSYIDAFPLYAGYTAYMIAKVSSMVIGALTDWYKSQHNGKSTSWEDIVVANDYADYDVLIDAIKNYYAKDDDDKACEVEDLCNMRFMELLSELDKKYRFKSRDYGFFKINP